MPRALGVAAYGQFSFVNNVITQILNFLDMRASTFFYVRLSHQPARKGVITFYGLYNLLVFLLLAISLLVLSLPIFRPLLFGEISNQILWLSFVFVCMKWMGDIFIRISDAYGATVFVEKIKIVNSILAISVLAVLFFSGFISVTVFYAHQIGTFFFLCLAIAVVFKRRNLAMPLVGVLPASEVRYYTKLFLVFSSPLAIYMTATLITEIFDRTLLQKSGGDFQQGLYGFSFSLSATTILFVTSMVPLFTRELSIAFSERDNGKAAFLYRRYVPMMYFVSAYFCCFISGNVEGVILLFGGEEYAAAAGPMSIMMLHPLVSTYSNLNSSVIYAKRSTVFIRNMILWVAPLGIAITYVLVSNKAFGLGASGLALKVTVLELITTILMLRHISKLLNMRIAFYLIHMVATPAVLISLSFSLKYLFRWLMGNDSVVDSLVVFFAAGIGYTILVACLVYFFPIFAGATKDQRQHYLNLVKAKLPWGRQ